MESILAILTGDVPFGQTLADYIINSHSLSCRVMPFFDEADYLQFKDANQVRVLLADEELEQSPCISGEQRIFYLTEERCSGEDRIFKYQSLEATVRELAFKLYGAADEARSDKACSLKAVMSGKGGCGVTVFSIMLAGILGKERQALLVSLDAFAEFPPDFEGGNGELSELIYMLKLGRSFPGEQERRYLRHAKDFDYIAGVLNFEDINSFGKDEMKRFLADISADGRYKSVIFDLGRLPPCAETVLEKCETIYLIGDENAETERQLKQLLGAGVSEKLRKISLPVVEDFKHGIPSYSEFENSALAEFARTVLEPDKNRYDSEQLTAYPVVRKGIFRHARE